MTARASRGRRPGAPDTRAEVLAAARSSFAEKGFRGTTIRAVASAAAVDPALVHHYFGTKDDLFLAALQMPVDPRELLAPVVAQGPDGAGERLLRIFLSVWDDPDTQVQLLAVVRSTRPVGIIGPSPHDTRRSWLPLPRVRWCLITTPPGFRDGYTRGADARRYPLVRVRPALRLSLGAEGDLLGVSRAERVPSSLTFR